MQIFFLQIRKYITIEQSQKIISSSHEYLKQLLSVIILLHTETKQCNGNRFGINVYQEDNIFLFLKRVAFKRSFGKISTNVRTML